MKFTPPKMEVVYRLLAISNHRPEGNAELLIFDGKTAIGSITRAELVALSETILYAKKAAAQGVEA